jgi:ABC-type multidrug transport system fused ATPase/permease subunit
MDKYVDVNRYFFEFIKSNSIMFTLYFILLVVYPIHHIVLPKYYGKVIHSLRENGTFESNVLKLIFIFVIIQILYTLNYKVQGHLIPIFSEYTTKEIFSEILKGFEYNYDNIEVGEILAKIIKIPNVLYKYLDLMRTLLFSQFTVMVGTFIHYFSISHFTAYVFLGLVCGLMLLQFISYKLTLNVELEREREKDHIYQHFQDVLNNLISVYVCKQQNSEGELMSEKFEPYVKVFNKSLDMNFILRLIFSAFNVISFMLLNYLIYKAYKSGKIDQETFISSFIITYSVLTLFSGGYYAVRSIIDMLSQINDTESYFNDRLNYKKKKDNERGSKYKNGDIQFQNVHFKYPNSDKFALKNVSFTINKGEKVAFVGQIGSGKSTAVKMLMKLIPCTMGKLTIDNQDINEIDNEDLRNTMFYIPQKPTLLNRTLYENITYGLPKSHDYEEEIYSILDNLNLNDTTLKFREKMHQPVGTDGTTLSGGQRQIVWLLRAMFRKVDILILDEPTASLDPESKQAVLNAIKDIGDGKTVIIISHDPIDNDFRKIEFRDGVHKDKTYGSIFSFLM